MKYLLMEMKKIFVGVMMTLLVIASLVNMRPSAVEAQSVPAGGIAYKNLLSANNSAGIASGDLRIDCRGASAVTFATSSTILSTWSLQSSADATNWHTDHTVSPSNNSVITTDVRPGAFYQAKSTTSGYNLSGYIACK